MINTRIPVSDMVWQAGADLSNSATVYIGLLFCGALGLLTFFILLIYLKTKERIYLYYCLFLLFNLLGGFINLSTITPINTLFKFSNGLAGAILELVTLLAFSGYCLFTISLLDIKVQNKKLLYWILAMAYGAGFYGLIYPVIRPLIAGHLLLYFTISRSIIMFMSIVAIFWVIIKIKSPFKNYFMIGSSWYFLGALLAILRETTGKIPFSSFYSFNATVYFQSGIFLETLCFALALSYRFYLFHEEKQQAQAKIHLQVVQEKEIAQAEALALRIQINPHFLFNCMSVLKYYIQSNQNGKASTYLITLSQFIRMVLDLSQKPIISLTQELNIIKKYLALEEARFTRRFIYKFKIYKNVDISEIKIPPMLLQPFVEEALWGGLLAEGEAQGELLIEIRQRDSRVTIMIEEHEELGKREKDMHTRKFHSAISRQLMAERVALFNKNYAGKISYHTKDKKNKFDEYSGSQTVINIQYLNNQFSL